MPIDDRPTSPMVPPSRLREPKPVRSVDGKKVAYVVSALVTLAGLVLLAMFLSWRVALAGALLEVGAAVFLMTVLVEITERLGGRRA